MSGFISQKQFREIFTELGGDKFTEREIRDLLKMAESEDGQVFFFFFFFFFFDLLFFFILCGVTIILFL